MPLSFRKIIKTNNGMPVIALVTFTLLLGLFEYGLLQWEQQRNHRNVIELTQKANVIRTLLESELITTASLATGLEAYIVARDGKVEEEDIEIMLGLIFERGRHFRNIGVAPGNQLTYIFPLEGNSQALGLRYDSNPQQWPAVKRVIDSGKGMLAGPLTLVQGGQGLIYRQPVFVNDQYWGLLSTVIDADSLFNLLNPLLLTNDFGLALRGKDAQGDEGEVFLGDPDIFAQEDALRVTVPVPGGHWSLAIVPKQSTGLAAFGLRILGWLGVALLTWLVSQFFRQQLQHATLARLESAVAERTTSLASANGLLESVLDSAADIAIIATDSRGKITLFNRGAERMLDYSAQSLIGHETPERFHRQDELNKFAKQLALVPTHEAGGFVRLAEAIAAKGLTASEWSYCRRDGSELTVQLMISKIRSQAGAQSGFLFLAEDVTERKRIDRLKSEFISTVSHELRTPLTAISGAVSLLLGGTSGQLSAQTQEILILANRNCQRLEYLINDLLDMEKLVAGKMAFQLQVQPLQNILDNTLAENQSYAAQFGVTIEQIQSDGIILVEVDTQRLQQVLTNLLSNAVKFSPVGASVLVRTNTSSDHVKVEVIDNGPGIPAEFQDRVFSKFAQADASDSRQRGGTGLGLAISLELTQRMGGTIGFSSTPGAGANFYIELPLAKEHLL